MTAFIVIKCWADPEYEIFAGFSSREKAEEWIAKQENESWPEWQILELELDKAS